MGIRRVASVRSLSQEAKEQLRIGGVVDRDWLTKKEAKELQSNHGVYVLSVHEVENFFLHPATVQTLLDQNGLTTENPTVLVQRAADARAGSWIFQNAMATQNARSLPKISTAAKDKAKVKLWSDFESDAVKTVDEITALSGYSKEHQKTLGQILKISAKSYKKTRSKGDFWINCEGKQVLAAIASRVGFSGPPAFEKATFALWENNSKLLPKELTLLRAYLQTL